jgi:hypothetical protein
MAAANSGKVHSKHSNKVHFHPHVIYNFVPEPSDAVYLQFTLCLVLPHLKESISKHASPGDVLVVPFESRQALIDCAARCACDTDSWARNVVVSGQSLVPSLGSVRGGSGEGGGADRLIVAVGYFSSAPDFEFRACSTSLDASCNTDLAVDFCTPHILVYTLGLLVGGSMSFSNVSAGDIITRLVGTASCSMCGGAADSHLCECGTHRCGQCRDKHDRICGACHVVMQALLVHGGVGKSSRCSSPAPERVGGRTVSEREPGPDAERGMLFYLASNNFGDCTMSHLVWDPAQPPAEARTIPGCMCPWSFWNLHPGCGKPIKEAHLAAKLVPPGADGPACGALSFELSGQPWGDKIKAFSVEGQDGHPTLRDLMDVLHAHFPPKVPMGTLRFDRVQLCKSGALRLLVGSKSLYHRPRSSEPSGHDLVLNGVTY